MAGRGRGRGGPLKGLSFNIDSLGIGRGEGMPTTAFQPPPLFPPLQYKAVPLEVSEDCNYMLALKQEFRGNSQESCHFLKAPIKKKDIERYSDKYKFAQGNDEFQPDWSRVPSELKPAKRKRTKKIISGKGVSAPRQRKIEDTVLETIKELEKSEEQQNEEEPEPEEKKKKEEGDDEGDENEEGEEYEEEEVEEENDYITEYFDNGEEYEDNDDDNADEGPIY